MESIGIAVSLTDAYQSVGKLIGYDTKASLIEGFLQSQTFGMTVRFGDGTTPPTAAVGLAVAAGAALGIGPVKSADASWDLGRIWVRNTVAGSNAVLAVVGIVG